MLTDFIYWLIIFYSIHMDLNFIQCTGWRHDVFCGKTKQQTHKRGQKPSLVLCFIDW